MGKIFVAVQLSIHDKRQIPNKIWVMWRSALSAIVIKLFLENFLYHFYDKLKKLSKH